MSDRNERVRALLERGDPAAGELDLSQEEVQAMRRTVLTAVPEPRRRWWLVPVLAATALVLVTVLTITSWRTARSNTAIQGAVQDRPSPREAVVTPTPAPRAFRPQPAVRVSQEKLIPPAPPAPEPPVPESVIAEGPQQIQFSTPGGTRVIWMLNPATE